ncbi:Gfo/Idh/MocA family protein [Roseimaritima sediminicola]|uniref:Gfo/Idh/MocA family protein n=1 Tax=Roseimaritima sediminicola TaxID=2662066 RepID=UPI001298388F|nr:Gfo/Idh/MocA family oxidoreductase [Roseimaritima sediminicola]
MHSDPASQHARDRRLFLKAGATVAAATVAMQARSQAQETGSSDAADVVTVGIMGVNGRGRALAKGFAADSGARVAYVCDVDSRAADRAAAELEKGGHAKPETVGDFRRILDDSSIDALVVATPNHWHAPATIIGCDAGKHVYVEKPCSHTAQEGEWAEAAAKKHKRVVQMGNQRRSWPALQEAVQKIHEGDIGEVLYSRTWYNNRRPSIGTGKITEPPQWLDWQSWQGPAPHMPYKDNVVHYNWHWHWHWGNGELGNNGIHALDVARWGLDVAFPTRVTAGGGKYRHDDDQETPDTMMVTYDFDEGKTITWEGLSWSTLGPHDSRFGISFHGTKGSLVIRGSGYTQFDQQEKVVAENSGAGGDRDHLADFLDAIRTSRASNSNIVESHRSTLLCHLGNIAYRTDSVLQTDPSNGHIQDNPAAAELWTRQYEPGWEPQV